MLAIFWLLVLLPVSQRADPSHLFKGGGKQAPGKYLLDRRSLPITAHEEFIPRVIMTQSGDQVLDFGQNLAGWVEFKNRLPKGNKVIIDFGEIMQDGEFYRDNLRSARAQFTYVSGGEEKWIRLPFLCVSVLFDKKAKNISVRVYRLKRKRCYITTLHHASIEVTKGGTRAWLSKVSSKWFTQCGKTRLLKATK